MADNWPEPTVAEPSDIDLTNQLIDAVTDGSVSYETSDGCEVEPDGVCHHGHPTWLRRAGLI
jgi:hypothetical protein